MNKYLRLILDRNSGSAFWLPGGFYRNMSDEELYRHKYRLSYGTELDLEHPKGFSEKMMWLKLHDRKPIYHPGG